MINESHINLLREIKEENDQVFQDSFLNLKLNEEARQRNMILDEIIEFCELSRTKYLTNLMK